MKQQKHIVYKIVTSIGGKRMSHIARFMGRCYNEDEDAANWLLEYSTRKLTRPKFGKIFAFDTLEHAQVYVKMCLIR